MEESILKNFEREYSREIKASDISLEEFSAMQIPEEALRAEIYLRSVYGDEFFEEFEEDSVNEQAKNIEKIGEQDLSLNKNLSKQIAKIETDEFNDVLESVLVKVGR